MDENLDFLIEDTAAKQPELTFLDNLMIAVGELKDTEKQLEDLEVEAKRLKDYKQKLSRDCIPEMLRTEGLESVTLSDGVTVSVTQDVAPKVEDMQAFADWLDDRGDSVLLRTAFYFDKLPPDVVQKLKVLVARECGLYPEVQLTIHPQTLKKYIKETVLPEHSTPETFVPVQDLPPCISVFVYNKTVLKQKRVKPKI